jgi:TonB family protein
MKNVIVLTALTLISISTSSLAKNIYADVQVTNIDPKNNFIWERANKKTPKYPIELARSGVKGCTVLSFNITKSGKTENVEVITSIPQKNLGKYSRKLLKKWKWIPMSNTVDIGSEKRTLRLDFCMGGESTELSQKNCKKQTQLACS